MAGHGHDTAVLNNLITSTLDSADGYERAGESAEAPNFKTVFRNFAQERRHIVARLQERVRELGDEPTQEGSTSAELQRRWADLKKLFAGENDRAIVAQVESGEDRVKGEYERALIDRSISPPTRVAIEQGYACVMRGHDYASRLKHTMERAEA